MDNIINRMQYWYESRENREKILAALLSFLVVYIIFYYFLEITAFSLQNKITQKNIAYQHVKDEWQAKIDIINKINENTIYKEWKKKQTQLALIENQYRNTIKSSSPNDWQNIIKSIININPSLNLLQLKNFPEQKFSPKNQSENNLGNIYEQTMAMSFSGKFFDTLHYIEMLEKNLPNIYWKNLKYQVTEYPTALIQLEFSILYEKNKY